ncbi:MAG: glycosyltransferase family 4 protein [Deltaproteobacteria bacterium]|nr:glycosyltransferase family 4 protein [Deltaproteobacteria bacterium]
MRVAFLAYRGSMQSGGLGIYLHALTRQLVDQGVEVDLYVGPPYPDPMPWVRTIPLEDPRFWDKKFMPDWFSFLPDSQLSIFRPLDFWEFVVTRFGFFPEPFAFSMRAAHAVVAELRRGVRYDLVHDVQTLGYGALWLRALGLPVVSTVHHPLTIDRRSSLARDRSFTDYKGSLTFHPVRSQARVARRLEGMITSSEASVDELVSGFGVRRERIHNVSNGVDLPAPGRIRARPERRELLFIGRGADPNKGLEYLLEALSELPPDVTLRLFDDPPPRLTAIHAKLEGLRLHDRVRFDGKVPRDELERALHETTTLVVPSLFEGFGLPAVEALAAGTPVVASAAGALPEVIRRAGAGLLVPPADSGALAKGILSVLENWESHQRDAVAARARIEREFGWHEVATRTLAVYQQVLGQTSRPQASSMSAKPGAAEQTGRLQDVQRRSAPATEGQSGTGS